MPRPHEDWTVLPHEALTPLDDNILTVTGHIKMPAGDLPRRMTVVRLRDRRLVIFSAIALDENEMCDLEAFGTPTFLVVPNDRHRLDAKSWKIRYPSIKVITPEGAREKVGKVVSVDATDINFNDPNVRFITVPGTHAHEAALEVSESTGITLVLNDIVGNIRDPKGFGGWLLRMMGFAGNEPHIPAPVRASIAGGKADLARQLRLWAGTPNLKRIVVSHGEIISDKPNEALMTLAISLN